LSSQLHKAILHNASALCNLQEITPEAASYSLNTNAATSTSTITTNKVNISSPSSSKTNNTSLRYTPDLSFTDQSPPPPTTPQPSTSPYYVNDLKSIVKLPASLSFVNSQDEETTAAATTSNYVNSELIDPSLVYLAKKLNSDSAIYSNLNFGNIHDNSSNPNHHHHQKSKKKNYEKLKDLLSPSSSSVINSNKLIYVTPDFLGFNLTNKSDCLSDDNSKEDFNAAARISANSMIEYVVIDPKKTQVIKSSTSAVKQEL
jgi:hypothetical protein